MSDFDAFHSSLREFIAERDRSRFHDPKSLVLALVGEVGELSELFQWLPAHEAAAQAHDEHIAPVKEQPMPGTRVSGGPGEV